MTMRSLVTTAVLAFASACQSGAPPANQPSQAAKQAPTAIPADVSHGEAKVGTAVDSAPVDPSPPPRATDHLVRVRFVIRDTLIEISKGVHYRAWAFEGRVPGPTIRVTQGDSVDFTLVNHGVMPHSMDFHAAQIAPSTYYVNVNPKVPRPAAHELVFVQSEFYMAPDTSSQPRSLSWDRLLGLAPDFVTFSGRAAQYSTHPITVKVNELLRLYVVNAGPNRFSSFHVVGGIFEHVFVDGSQTSPLTGVQTVAVPVGGASIFEIRLKQPGDYPFVTHAFADATKGAVGIFKAQ